jgi:hypothetical protein
MCERGIDLAAKSHGTTRERRRAAVRSERRRLWRSASMLRVITERQGDSYRLNLHGTLGGEWVRVLEQHWRSIVDNVTFANVTVVLSNVDFIDSEGERLLHRMASQDVEFVVAGCMNRYVIDSLRPGASTAEGGRR